MMSRKLQGKEQWLLRMGVRTDQGTHEQAWERVFPLLSLKVKWPMYLQVLSYSNMMY
jgi:hypothetical protein